MKKKREQSTNIKAARYLDKLEALNARRDVELEAEKQLAQERYDEDVEAALQKRNERNANAPALVDARLLKRVLKLRAAQDEATLARAEVIASKAVDR